MSTRLNAPNPTQEYQIAVTASASTAQLMALPDTSGPARVELEARGDTVIFCFGGSGVAASATKTGNALTAPNFSVAQNAIIEYDVEGLSQNYVSVISNDGQATGTAIVRVCAVRK